MIRVLTLTHYQGSCDVCGVLHPQLSAKSKEQLIEDMKKSGWIVDGDKNYCPEHKDGKKKE